MSAFITTAFMGLFAYSNLMGTTTVATLHSVEPEVLATHTVSLTGYNAVPEQTDGDPFTTASGAYSNPSVVAARSVDLAEDLPFGTIIQISAVEGTPTRSCGLSVVEEQIGYRVVADSMHPRKRQQIDLMFDATNSVSVSGKRVNPAVALGVCKGVEIKVIGRVSIKEIPKDQAELKKVVGEQILAVKKF